MQIANDLDSKLGHSVKYLAAKSRSEAEVSRKRKAFEEAKADAKLAKKRAKFVEAKSLQRKLAELQVQAVETLQNQLAEGAKSEMQKMYGDDWKVGMNAELDRLAERQRGALQKRRVLEEHERQRTLNSTVQLGSAGTLLGE